MPDLDPLLLASCLFALAVIGLALYVARLAARITELTISQADLEQQLALAQQVLSGLIAGATGTDKRLHDLELGEQKLSERQETIENQTLDDQPYGQAIRLVRSGAGTSRLVEELDISESEAELLVRLHSHRISA